MANYTVTKQFAVSVVFMLIFIHWGCCQNTNCDVNHCKSLFSTVFKDFLKKGTQRLCRSQSTLELHQCSFSQIAYLHVEIGKYDAYKYHK
ncbi:unnamed protein product [Larinioides sclopetarius]|uniref:Uncharacterized protein n=1 Tax=Larinioides sclopetarius TaxID=280406 RepID=A0AAV1Z8Q6_9ARAC